MSSSSSPIPEADGGAMDTDNTDTRDPSGFLGEIIGAPVVVKLNSGITFKGILQSVDGYMNIALEAATEVHEGYDARNWGDAFIRGNNVTYICADRNRAAREGPRK